MNSVNRTAVALHGKVGISEASRRLLLDLELKAVGLLHELHAAAPQLDPLLASEHEVAVESLSTFLDGPPATGLRKALRRVHRMDSHSAVRRSLLTAWRQAQGMATRVLDRDQALRAYRALYAEFQSFGEFPWTLAQRTASLSLEPDQLVKAAASMIRAKHTVLQREVARLSAARGAIPLIRSSASGEPWPIEVSRQEVALSMQSLPPHQYAPASLIRRRRLRELNDAHRRAWLIGSSSPSAADWSIELAGEIIERWESGHGISSDDLDARSISLQQGLALEAWPSPKPQLGIAAERSAVPSNWYVRPLFGDYVLIQAGIPSPAVVSESAPRLGSSVLVSVVLPQDVSAISLPFHLWGAPLFRLPSDLSTGLLEVQRQATVDVVGKVHEEAWLGRVKQPGELVTSAAPSATSIRFLNASCYFSDVVPLVAQATIEQTREFAGILSRDAIIPVEDHPMAELHTASSAAALDALANEQLFFFRAATRIGGIVPRPLGSDARSDGCLYAPLVARPVSHSEVVSRLRNSQPLVLAGAVARLWRNLTAPKVGLALGLYHLDALAFRCIPAPIADDGTCGARLEAVVSFAPVGCAIGQPYATTQSRVEVHHQRLGGISLTQTLQGLGTATAFTEGHMALWLIAELLTRRTLQSSVASAHEMASFLGERARVIEEDFYHADLVQQIARVLLHSHKDSLNLLQWIASDPEP